MAYTIPDKIREILGIDEIDASDDVLESFIADATKIVIKRTSVEVLDETLIAENASETIFETKFPFIADKNGDKKIDKNDFTMYTWTDSDDEDTKEAIAVAKISSFHGETGQIKLTEKPDTIRGETVDRVSIDYNYYLNRMDFDLANLATAYLAGRMWVERELLLVPKQYKVGRIMMKGQDAWKRLDQNFERTIHLIVILPMDKITYKQIMKGAREDTLKDAIDLTKRKVRIPEDIC